jgi:hypothetical protein
MAPVGLAPLGAQQGDPDRRRLPGRPRWDVGHPSHARNVPHRPSREPPSPPGWPGRRRFARVMGDTASNRSSAVATQALRASERPLQPVEKTPVGVGPKSHQRTAVRLPRSVAALLRAPNFSGMPLFGTPPSELLPFGLFPSGLLPFGAPRVGMSLSRVPSETRVLATLHRAKSHGATAHRATHQWTTPHWATSHWAGVHPAVPDPASGPSPKRGLDKPRPEARVPEFRRHPVRLLPPMPRESPVLLTL